MWDRQFYRYHAHTPYRQTNDESLGKVIERMVAAYGFKHKLQEVKIRAGWESSMGQTIAKYTQNIRLKDKRLYIHIQAASLRQELAYNKDKIVQWANDLLGEKAVEEVLIL